MKYFNFLVILYIFHNAAIYTDGQPILWYVWTHGSSSGDLGTKRLRRRTVDFFWQLESLPNIGRKRLLCIPLAIYMLNIFGLDLYRSYFKQ